MPPTMGTIVERTTIPHTAFIQAEARLNQLYAFAGNKGEAEGLALIGESGTGKTSGLRNHAKRYPQVATENGTDIPVLLTSVPSRPTVKSLAYRMLDDMGVEDPERGTEEEKSRRLRRLMQEVGMKMVMIDEFQHFVDQGTHKVMHYVADWLKTLIDQTKVTLVIAGLPTCMAVIDQNVQLARRFSAPIVMPRFDWDNNRDRKQFRSILRGFHAQLVKVYDCPDLSTEDMGFRIYLATGGLMGYLVRLLRQVERNCATENRCKITLEDFDEAHMQAIWSAERRPELPKPFSTTFQLAVGNDKLESVRSIGTVLEPTTLGPKQPMRSRRARNVSELLVG